MIHEDHAPVTSVRFSPNGKYVLAWTLDSAVRLWSYVDGRCVKTYQGHTNTKFSIGGAFGIYFKYGGSAASTEPPSALVVSGSEDGSLWIWDVGTKNVLQKVDKAHSGVVFGTDAYSTSRLIVSGGEDGVVKIWQADESSDERLDEHGEMDVDKGGQTYRDGSRNMQEGETMDLDDPV